MPLVARPIFIKRLRDHYLLVGRSEHRRTHQRMLAAVERAFRERGDASTRFYGSFLDDNPRPDAALIQALNEGASRVDAPLLRSMFVARANAQRGHLPREQTAILLVGHGQPDDWDREWPTETEQEIAFREQVLELFVADGYRRDLLGIAWMEFKQPRPAALVERFVAAVPLRNLGAWNDDPRVIAAIVARIDGALAGLPAQGSTAPAAPSSAVSN